VPNLHQPDVAPVLMSVMAAYRDLAIIIFMISLVPP
jgi:hypothetical protein